jgi:hypothetical protein
MITVNQHPNIPAENMTCRVASSRGAPSTCETLVLLRARAFHTARRHRQCHRAMQTTLTAVLGVVRLLMVMRYEAACDALPL